MKVCVCVRGFRPFIVHCVGNAAVLSLLTCRLVLFCGHTTGLETVPTSTHRTAVGGRRTRISVCFLVFCLFLV